MSTVAYKDGVIASDMLVVQNGMRLGHTAIKIFRKVGDFGNIESLHGCCGHMYAIQAFFDKWDPLDLGDMWCPAEGLDLRVLSGKLRDVSELLTEKGFSAFTVLRGRTTGDEETILLVHKHHFQTSYLPLCPGNKGFAIGSGADFAFGAMAAGASALEAARIASKFDLYTGSEFQELSFKSGDR